MSKFDSRGNRVQHKEVQKELNHLLRVGAIVRCKESSQQFISPYFLVKKRGGRSRFILNLKRLNMFIEPPHFKMEDFRTVIKLIRPDYYMTTIDLKDAYWLIPIHEKFKKFLRFRVGKNLYQFECIPFGLSIAPYIFTKLIKPIVTFLRSQNIMVVAYLDDFIIISPTKSLCFEHTQVTTELLTSLGFIINLEKSRLKPSKICRYLGFIFNTEEMSLGVPSDKRVKIYDFIQRIKQMRSCRIRQFAKFIGLLISVCPAIKYSKLYTKGFEREKFLALRKCNQNYNKRMYLSENIKGDLDWWAQKILHDTNTIRDDKFTLEMYTDASTTGWGVYSNNITTYGWWSNEEKEKHINYLELKAIFYGLKCMAKNLKSCNILIRVDNTTAISYINRMGSIQHPTLCQLAKEIWQWCESQDLWIQASYVTTKNNIADDASRKLSLETEWELAEAAFNEIVRELGQPEIDLFASIANRKVETYVSWHKDPGSVAVDAFTISWTNKFFYAFPPFSIILRTLNKIISDKAQGIVVAPNWPSQPWYPLFKKLVVPGTKLTYLKPNSWLLSSPFREQHPLHKTLSLVVGILSGRHI